MTTVAVHAVNSILGYAGKFLPEIEEIVFVSGRNDNLDNIITNQIQIPPGAETVVTYHVSDSIDYVSDKNGIDTASAKKTIISLFKRFSGYLWWVHNYHLGKNPLFTRLLARHLLSDRSQNALLHIHDFPECARPDNYRFLTGETKNLYPLQDNICYAAINSRDERYLREAGIPEDQVFLLYDPVPGLKKPKIGRDGKEFSLTDKSGGNKEEPAGRDKGRNKSKSILSREFSTFFPSFNPSLPFALYPVRTIRRKNVLEAALLAWITGEGFNLIVTLPGISKQEKNYSQRVRQCFEDGLVPGIWGCGSTVYGKTADFSDVVSAADFVISTSTIEGFGYFFIDSLRWKKPLVSKYLEISEGFKDIFKNSAHYFYDCVKVPLEYPNREKIKQLYRKSIKKYSGIIEEVSIDALLGQIDSIIDQENVDFSYLPVDVQVEVLYRIKADREYRLKTKMINNLTLDNIRMTIELPQNFDREKAGEYFSFESFAEMFDSVCRYFDSRSHGGSGIDTAHRALSPEIENILKPSDLSPVSVSENLLNLFFRPEYLRLILSEK